MSFRQVFLHTSMDVIYDDCDLRAYGMKKAVVPAGLEGCPSDAAI